MRWLVIIGIMLAQPTPFKQTQQQYSRVKSAYAEKEATVKQYFVDKNLAYENFELFIRVFKKDKVLEVWVKPKTQSEFLLLHQYDICAASGVLGPKRREGDLQVPEGVYHVSHFNPQSNFHLSLGLNYPNSSDKVLSNKAHPGGSIYIHGNCVTIGCIPITDEKIKELYILAVEARNGGQQTIPIHVFPTRLTAEGLTTLKQTYNDLSLQQFWGNLKLVYDDFEQIKKLRPAKVDSRGRYYF